MEEKFAPEATVKDKRVQEMAFTDERVTIKTITETVAIQPKLAVSVAEVVEDVPEEEKFEELEVEDLDSLKVEYVAIKADPASSADEKAAAEILEEVVIKQREEKVREVGRIPKYYKNSRDMFSSIKLYKAPEEGSLLLAKIEKYSAKKVLFQGWLVNRGFGGGVLANSDKLLKADGGSALALAAPPQAEVAYADFG